MNLNTQKFETQNVYVWNIFKNYDKILRVMYYEL